MGVDLSFLVFDSLPDSLPAARLSRAVDALDAWGHVDSFRLQPAYNVSQSDFDKLVRGAGLPSLLNDGEHPITLDELRAAIAVCPHPDWLVVAVRSRLMPMDLTVLGTAARPWTPADRARLGDLRLYTWTAGRRIFQDPLCVSDEAERLEAEIAAARLDGPRWKVNSLQAQLDTLADRNRRERRQLLVSLYEAFATSFGAASIRAHLDYHAALPPLSSMIYYRNAQALCDDLTLIAAVVEAEPPTSVAGTLAYLLRSPEKKGRWPALSDTTVRHLLARLRSIAPAEAQCALTSSQYAAPLADGVLVSNTNVLPVGDTLVPFFQELVG